MRPPALLTIAVAAAALLFCGSAEAEIITVGPPLTAGTWVPKQCESSGCAFFNDYGKAPEPGVPPVWPESPERGVIVRLNVAGGTTPGQYRVRTMAVSNQIENLFLTASAPLPVVPSAGVQTYPMSMPVLAGNLIALSTAQGASIGFQTGVGEFSRWDSDPPESGDFAYAGREPGLAGFNVEIQPPPSISTLSNTPIASPAPTSSATPIPPPGPSARVAGPTTGGTKVIISGNNLEGASAVTFGAVPAAGYTVVSEGEVDAIAPPSATPASVPISVTTIAGTATSGQKFEYFVPPVLCTVPALKGKSLKAARRALVAAHCGLGTVTRRAGAKARSGKVVRQGSAPGSQFAAGAKVAVTLKPPKAARHKHR